MLKPSRVVFALHWVALIVVLALAAPPLAHAQTRSDPDTPSELWKTYPLDPSNGKARIQREEDAEQETGPPPPTAETGVSNGSNARNVEKEPSPVGGGDSDMVQPLALLGLSLLGLLLLLLVARPAARLVPSVPGSVARFSSALASPVRSVASAPRPKLRSRPRSRSTSVARTELVPSCM